MNCNKCGSPLALDATVCPVCGTSVFNQPSSGLQTMVSSQNMNQLVSNSNINQNNSMNTNNQEVVSTNGLQLGAFNQNNVGNAPLINPSKMNQQNMPTDDIFSSPKVTVNQGLVNNGMQSSMFNQNNNQGMMNNQPMMQSPMNNNYGMMNQQNNGSFFDNKKSSNKLNMKLVVIGCAALVLIIVGVFSFKYFQDVQKQREALEQEEIRKEVEDSIDDYEKQREEKAAQMKKNITLAEETVLYDGSLLFTYENNNNVVSVVEFEIKFFDKDGNSLGTAKDYAYPAPYSKFLIKVNKYSVKEGYAKYEINLNVNDYDLVPLTINTSKFLINDTGESIVVQYNNDDEDTIDNLELCILYYNGETIVGAECSSKTDITPGTSADYEFEYYYANNYEGLIFDTYKFAVSAYNKAKSDY